MGDDDIICLSSDDETIPVQSSVKKLELVKPDLETIACQSVNLKRKSHVPTDSRLGQIKKPRVSCNGLASGIGAPSSLKSTNGVSGSTLKAVKVGSNHSAFAEKVNVHKNPVSKITGEFRQKSNSRVLEKETNKSKNNDNTVISSNNAKLIAENPKSINSRSKQSSESRPLSKVSSKNEPPRFDVSKNLEDKKKTEKTSGSTENKTKDSSAVWVEDRLSDFSNVYMEPLENLSNVSVSKPSNKKTSKKLNLPASSRRSRDDERLREQPITNTPRSDLTKSDSRRKSTEKFERSVKSKSSKTDNDRSISGSLSSPDIEIVEVPESPTIRKINGISGNKLGSKPEKLHSSIESSKIKSKNNVQSPISQNSRSSTIANTSKDENKKDPLKASQKLSNSKVDGSRTNDSFEIEVVSNESTSRVTGDSPSKENTNVKKRIALKRVTSIQQSKPNDSDTKNCTMRNGDSSKSSKSDDKKESSEPFEPVAGCSKTPDIVCFAEPKKKKLKSTLDPSIITTPRKPAENNEPDEKLETSKEQENSMRPHLVVKTKEPASVEQDTFAIFLSLCLQIERSPEMEKIVAKLKRHYDRLDPAYSRSRMFSDFLNKIREKILEKGRIYCFIGQVADEMKSRRKQNVLSKTKEKKGTTDVAERKETDGNAESSKEINDDDDHHESRRHRHKIKTIEMAMKSCAKRIQRLEVAEVDLEDDNDSNYIKLERYKSKMIQLYNKLCEYTNEHPDAGRAYLRPKHLRVTQIPSIDQAINSFINSKLSYNRKKAMSGKSFIDGLVFPDYVDILECVSKVNDDQKLGLDKRRQQQLAKEAFTSLGKHLQEARQHDYWDTFSQNLLENSEDPAAADSTLADKLSQNQKVAEKNMSEIFEEYVRKQEAKNAGDQKSTNSESECDDDDDEEEEDEDEKKSKSDVSDTELSDNEDVESSGQTENEKNSTKALETLPESQNKQESLKKDINDETRAIEVEDTIRENNVLENVNHSEDIYEEVIEILKDPLQVQSPHVKMTENVVCSEADPKKKDEKLREASDPSVSEEKTVEASEEKGDDVPKLSDEMKGSSTDTNGDDRTKTSEIGVNHAVPDTEEEMIEQPKVLRIRSFAKPPSSWANSQQTNTKDADETPVSETAISTETIDVLDVEPETPTASPAEVLSSPRIINEVIQPVKTTTNAQSSSTEQFIIEVSRKIGEQSSSLKKNRSTIVIRSPKKSVSIKQPEITSFISNQAIAMRKNIAIAANSKSYTETVVQPSQNRPQQKASLQNEAPRAPAQKIRPWTRPCVNEELFQNHAQQASLQKHIASAPNTITPPWKSQFNQQQNSSLQKPIAIATKLKISPENGKIQSSQNRTNLHSSVQKNVSIVRTIKVSLDKNQSSQNRHQQNSSVQKYATISRNPKISPGKSQSSENSSIRKQIQPAAVSKASAGNSFSSSLNVSGQTTILSSTVIGKERTKNITHSMPLQNQLLSFTKCRVISLENPQSIEVKVAKNLQTVRLEPLKAVKLANNIDQIRTTSNNLFKGNSNKNNNNNNNNNNSNNNNNNNQPRTIGGQILRPLKPKSSINATNPMRPDSQALQQCQPHKKPVNSQPIVKLQVSPNPQIINSVQQQLKNVSKATIRPLGVSSIQAQGITLKNPRLIRLPGNLTVAAAAVDARSVDHSRVQNALQIMPRLSNNLNSLKTAQTVNRQPIQKTNCVFIPSANNITTNNYQQQNVKRAGEKHSVTPQNSQPPPKK